MPDHPTPTAIRTPLAQAALLILFLLATIAVYLPGIPGDYLFDDMSNILHNPWMELESLDIAGLRDAAFSSGAGVFRRPVSMVSFALNRYFFGIEPGSYKIANLAIHLLTGLGILLLTRALARNTSLPEPARHWLPVLVTAAWLLHPLNLTPVLYIVQRMASLAALFTVFGLYLYTLGRERMLAGRPGISLILTGLLLFGSLACLSKETGVLLPLYMLAIEVSLFRFRAPSGGRSRLLGGFFAAVIGIPLLLFLLVLLTRPELLLNYSSRNFTLVERVLTEGRVLMFYLKLIVMPSISELGLYHDDIAVSHGLLDPPTTLYSLLGLTGLFGAALALLRPRPLAALGILWFFAGHALESTIFQLDLAYEHRNYLPGLGILLALGALVAQQPVSRKLHRVKIVAPFVFLLLFAQTTWLRASQWQDNVDHAIYEARHHPDSPRALFAAARIYARLALQNTPGAAEKAYGYLDRSEALDRTSIITDMVRVKLTLLLKRPVDPQWYDNMLDILANRPMKPASVDALRELTNCIGITCDVPLETMDRIMRTALDNPSLEHLPGTHAELLNIYGQFVINKLNDFHKGYDMFTRVRDLQPEEPQRWINLIMLQIAMQRIDEAAETLADLRASGIRGSTSAQTVELESQINALRAETDNPDKGTTGP